MRDSKGISMISLIVTVICMILLASIAIGTGSKYIRESRSNDRAAFVSVMSNAVARRHADTVLNSTAYPYLGYYINDSVIFEKIFVPKVSEPIKYENGIWYVLDTSTARELGVKEPEKYIETIDISYPEIVKVALVDYATGKVYLIDAKASEMSGLDSIISGPVVGHDHRYVDEINYPNCTEPLKCADCGFILKESLGHKYDADKLPEPASGDEENAHYNRQCIVCGMQGGYEPHDFEYLHLVKNGNWHHRAYCIICGYEKKYGIATEERCTEVIKLPESDSERTNNHIRSCRVCGHSVNEGHNIGYRRISESMHEVYCTNELCGYRIRREYHVDNDNNSKCDLCNSDIVSYSYPQLGIVEMSNANPLSEEQKYVAKYGDNISLKIIADKAIKKETLDITIAGQKVPQEALVTTDNKTWNIIFYLNPNVAIPNGNIAFRITCESMSGVELPAPVTSPSDGKRVVFDGTAPLVQYIQKVDRIDEKE